MRSNRRQSPVRRNDFGVSGALRQFEAKLHRGINIFNCGMERLVSGKSTDKSTGLIVEAIHDVCGKAFVGFMKYELIFPITAQPALWPEWRGHDGAKVLPN